MSLSSYWQPSLVHVITLIAVLVLTKITLEAIVLFNGMREAGPNPDKVTMIEVLSACSTIGALDLGKWVETHASERGL
ncbi:hypothetical protein NC651_036444 [Populus alba x Populus x berolinensis]|nr:hypothetical protein NC651_036444 [Populus alba x Populus x berolinensis]